MRTKKNKTLSLVQFAILLAVEAIFCFTPLGSLPALGPIVATLAMVPVVITALVLGTRAGTLMGAAAGLFSFLVWTFTPPTPISAFVFTPFYTFGEFSGNFGSVLICFVPRILVGTVTGLAYRGLSKALPKKEVLPYALAGALGSLTNTILVMLGIWVFFGNQYSSIAGQSMLILIGITVVTSGIPEAVINGIVAPVVSRPLKKILAKSTR